MVNDQSQNINDGHAGNDSDPATGHAGNDSDPATFDGVVQFSPRIDEHLADRYKDMVRLSHNGSFRSKFGPFLEEGLKLHLVIHFLIYPQDLDNTSLVDDINSKRELLNDLRDYRWSRSDLARVLEELPEELVRQAANSSPAEELFVESAQNEFFDSNSEQTEESGEDSEQRETTQIGPNIGERLNDLYKNCVRLANNGKFRTNFGPFVENAMKYHIAICLLRDDNIEHKIDQADYIEDPEEFKQDLQIYVDEVKGDLARAYLNIPEVQSEKMNIQSMKERLFTDSDPRESNDPADHASHLYTDPEQTAIASDRFVEDPERYFNNVKESLIQEDPEDTMAPLKRSVELLREVFEGIDYDNLEEGKKAEYKLLGEIQRALNGDASDADDIIADLQEGANRSVNTQSDSTRSAHVQGDRAVDGVMREIFDDIQNFQQEEGQSETIEEIKGIINEAQFGGKEYSNIIDRIHQVTTRTLENDPEPGLERAILKNIKHTIDDYYRDRPDRTPKKTGVTDHGSK